MGKVTLGAGAASEPAVPCAHAHVQRARQATTIRAGCTSARFATSVAMTRRERKARSHAAAKRAAMTSNADVILFTYSIVLVGLVTGAHMLYVGAITKRPMRLGGAPLEPHPLRAAGAVFTVAGVLAFAVMAAEILSGAAGTDIRPFIIATIVVPPVVVAFNVWRDRAQSRSI